MQDEINNEQRNQKNEESEEISIINDKQQFKLKK